MVQGLGLGASAFDFQPPSKRLCTGQEQEGQLQDGENIDGRDMQIAALRAEIAALRAQNKELFRSSSASSSANGQQLKRLSPPSCCMLPLIHGHASLFTKLIAEFLDIPSGLKLAHLRMVQQKASCIEEHFEKLDEKLLKRKHDMDTERDNIYCECCADHSPYDEQDYEYSFTDNSFTL